MKKILVFLGLLLGKAQADITLQALNLSALGQIRQMALDEAQQLWLINQQGQLWQAFPARKVAEQISPAVRPFAGHGKIAMADAQGHFMLLAGEQVFHSQIPLSPQAGMVILPFAVIAVGKEGDSARLLRIETKGQEAVISAVADTPILPDAQPIQMNFAGDVAQGHIAILAAPDNSTYQHGVLGDDLEAAQVQFLERHSLQPLAKSLQVQGLVFEANRFAILPYAQGNYLVAILSGNGEGARLGLIDLQEQGLQVVAESAALPQKRWQSPFVFQNQLYAVQMPHLNGKLVAYEMYQHVLQPKTLAQGLSNHMMGSHETNLNASTANFALIAQKDYQHVSVLLPNQRVKR